MILLVALLVISFIVIIILVLCQRRRTRTRNKTGALQTYVYGKEFSNVGIGNRIVEDQNPIKLTSLMNRVFHCTAT